MELPSLLPYGNQNLFPHLNTGTKPTQKPIISFNFELPNWLVYSFCYWFWLKPIFKLNDYYRPMTLSLMFHRILTTMFVNYYVCCFEISVKILNIRLFINRNCNISFQYNCCNFNCVNRNLDRLIWENIFFNEYDTCINKASYLISPPPPPQKNPSRYAGY